VAPRRAVLAAGFTLLEMLTTIAALMIVFILMVSLANRVRGVSADNVTKAALRRLEDALAQYRKHANGALPAVTPLVAPIVGGGPAARPDEAALRAAAAANNQDVVRALRAGGGGGFSAKLAAELPASLYDDRTVRDAWGSPIAFLPKFDPDIGMALGDRPFFVSAGPDRRYLTREDNLYSYEESGR